MIVATSDLSGDTIGRRAGGVRDTAAAPRGAAVAVEPVRG